MQNKKHIFITFNFVLSKQIWTAYIGLFFYKKLIFDDQMDLVKANARYDIYAGHHYNNISIYCFFLPRTYWRETGTF